MASALALACAETPPSPPNLILISIDTLRADHLGTYGYPRDTSPNLDAFGQRGVVFENALAPSAWTLPSHATMMTGMAPQRHGAVGARYKIRNEVAVLAEQLAETGYRTAAVVNGPFVGQRFGFARGFESFDYIDPVEIADHQRQVMKVLRAAEPPFFLFFHYMSVHHPYDPPAEFDLYSVPGTPRPEGRENLRILKAAVESGARQLDDAEVASLRDRYDGEIRHMDATLGKVFEALGDRMDRDTYVLITSDHGEEFLDHGGLTHAGTLYQELVRVPLLVRGPDVPNDLRVSALAGLVDVMPTFLDWAGLPVPAGVQGKSLREIWAQRETPERHLELFTGYAFVGTEVLKVGVRTQDLKLIVDVRTDAREIYDLARDPEERRNLHGLHAEGARLVRLLPKIQVVTEAETSGSPSEEEHEQLRGLGYVE